MNLRLLWSAYKLPIVLGGLLLLCLAFWLTLDAYGDSRYREGEASADAKWQKAFDDLKVAAAKSASKADDAAAKRVESYTEAVKQDQKRVEQAQAEGKSPLDALFGG